MTSRGAGPLTWMTSGGYTPESVRRSNRTGSIPVVAVVDMLNAADDAHIKRLYEENAKGGKARELCASFKSRLDDALGQIQRLSDERGGIADLLILANERADAAIRREEAAEERFEEKAKECAELRDDVESLNSYAARLELERDNYKRAYELKPAVMRLEGEAADRLSGMLTSVSDLRDTIVSQAREITRLKGESA